MIAFAVILASGITIAVVLALGVLNIERAFADGDL